MGVTQYIGSRYVPVFADPADWNSTRTYEPLTIVMNEGNSYTSKQYVPKGIDISNEDYWAETGNYNSQVELYRKEVLGFDARITAAGNTANKALETGTLAGNTANKALETGTLANSKVDSSVFLIIGDSWTDITNAEFGYANWVKSICESDSRVKCYGVGGSKILEAKTQLDRASSDTTFENACVKKILMVNGFNNGNGNNLGDINEVVSYANSVFKNSEFVYMNNCASPIGAGTSYYNYMAQTYNYLININHFGYVPLPFYLNCPAYFSNDRQNVYFDDDKKYGIMSWHLSEAGCVAMKRIACNVLYGASNIYYRTSGTITQNVYLIQESGVVTSMSSYDIIVQINGLTHCSILLPSGVSLGSNVDGYIAVDAETANQSWIPVNIINRTMGNSQWQQTTNLSQNPFIKNVDGKDYLVLGRVHVYVTDPDVPGFVYGVESV